MKCPMLKLQYREFRPILADHPDYPVEVMGTVFQECIGKECAWWKRCSLEQVSFGQVPNVASVEPSDTGSYFGEVSVESEEDSPSYISGLSW